MIQDDDEKLTSVYVWFAPNEDAGEDTRGVPRLLRSHRRRLEEASTTCWILTIAQNINYH